MASRIEDYAMIGDGRTAALVSRDGSIDWLCLPRFDADPCCAALLGTEQNGCWRIAPCEATSIRRSYQGDTLVLETEFAGASGIVRLTDFMPVGTDHPTVVRTVSGLEGSLRMRCDLTLRFDFGLLPPRLRRHKDALVAIAGPDLVALRAPVPLEPDGNGAIAAEFDVAAGQEMAFVMLYGPSHRAAPCAIDAATAAWETLEFWRGWASQFTRETPWREPVMRSLLTLKALSYQPTGAIIAAVTTSLPEMPGGELNWDYRYCWLRDASFTLSALLNAGYHREAIDWRDWMLRAIAAAPDKMRIMYRVDGSRRINEWQVGWLPGFEGASPVRSGNDAAAQRQIDVVGELLDALDLITRAGIDQTPETVAASCDLVKQLQEAWGDKGHGLWEFARPPAALYLFRCHDLGRGGPVPAQPRCERRSRCGHAGPPACAAFANPRRSS